MGSLIFSYSRLQLSCISSLLHTRPCLVYFNKSVLSCFKLAQLTHTCFVSTKYGNENAGRFKKELKQKDFRDNKGKPHFRSPFAAGTAKRTSDFLKGKSGEDVAELAKNTEKVYTIDIPGRPLVASEWRDLKGNDNHTYRFEIRMMERMLNAGSDINVAKSLLAYVAVETGSLPYELLLRYLTLCVKSSHHSEVFDLYEIMTSRFKTLDTGAYSLFIKGFSRTERWRESLHLLESVKKVITPSPRNYGDVIDGALRHIEFETAWALYDDLLEKGLQPSQDTWRSLFQSGLSDHPHEERLRDILAHMRDNQLYPEELLARSISAWFEGLPGKKWRGSLCTVEPSGLCRNCRSTLESIQLSEAEYQELKDRVMTDIIQGGDIFTKSTPEELERFRTFVKRKPPFDVVVDGLNVANTTPKGSQSETLLAVVSELERPGRKVLVLGRKHMLRPTRSWNQHHMTLLQQVAHCFFTENISEDDPFLLYAALHSGNHCLFVSRDLMRNHKARLPDGATRRLFFKWQRGHQLVLSSYVPGGRARFQGIPNYDTIVQTDGMSWHIPYDEDGSHRCSYEVPQKWLCLTRKG